METLVAESGHRIFKPSNKVEFRGMVTGINLFIEETGIPQSQRAKYDVTAWGCVGAYLPGKDKKDCAVTCEQISEKLRLHGILRSRHAIHSMIVTMINRQAAIHPHRRNIGRNGFSLVEQMGGIKFVILPAGESGKPYPVKAYYFGKPHVDVLEIRRRFGLIIRG